jgi:hypothetical protein
MVADRPVRSPTVTDTTEPAAPAGAMTVMTDELLPCTYVPTPPMYTTG